MVIQTRGPCTWEVSAGKWRLQSLPWLHSKFKTGLGLHETLSKTKLAVSIWIDGFEAVDLWWWTLDIEASGCFFSLILQRFSTTLRHCIWREKWRFSYHRGYSYCFYNKNHNSRVSNLFKLFFTTQEPSKVVAQRPSKSRLTVQLTEQ